MSSTSASTLVMSWSSVKRLLELIYAPRSLNQAVDRSAGIEQRAEIMTASVILPRLAQVGPSGPDEFADRGGGHGSGSFSEKRTRLFHAAKISG
jgi:hypothetical protein